MKIKDVNRQELEADIASIDNSTLEEINALQDKYKEAIEEINKPKEKKSTKASSGGKKYKFPFLMYFGHEYRDVSNMFEDGQEYSEAEITLALANHGYKEFKIAPQVEYEYFEDENCLFPKFKVGNRG